MSTNAIATIYDEWEDKPICAIYKHWDGYPSGFGEELKTFVKGIKVVNGLTFSADRVANGMGCLAAQVVSHFKKTPGDVYMTPVSDDREEYNYHVRFVKEDEPASVTCDEENTNE